MAWRSCVSAVAALTMVAGCAKSPPGLADGSYRAVLEAPAGELPFGLDIAHAGGAPVATIVNGADRVRAEQTRYADGTLTLAFPSYDASLALRPAADGGFTGTAHLYRRTGRIDVPLVATRGAAPRFFATTSAPAATLGGRWPITTSGDRPERGVLLLEQHGNDLSGSIQFASGDERFLVGQVSGDRFALSTFDGNQGSVWRGRIRPDGTLAGDSFGPASSSADGWTSGIRNAPAATGFAAVAEEKPPVEHLSFTFPDANGKRVSLSDPRFRGKVVVIAIGGTWCPNCHDESAFLAPYVKRRAAEGLAAIGLEFEYDADPVRSAQQVRRFAERYGISYPMLIAGVATPEDTRRALPQIGGVKVYPSTLFIDRHGRLRAIHIGYAGPATGALNVEGNQAFDALVSKLLAEPPAGGVTTIRRGG